MIAAQWLLKMNDYYAFSFRDHAEAVQGQICASAREDPRPTETQQIK